MSEPVDAQDPRKIRFLDLGVLARDDLPLACEVWLDGLVKAPWATREAMKVATQLVRYMLKPSAAGVSLNELETLCQLNPEEVRKTLNLMRAFGVVEHAQTTRTEVLATLSLSRLQQLHVLECRHQFRRLAPPAPAAPLHVAA
jgi:hypothetical protein